MHNLTILLLGPPQFLVDGVEVTTFNTRKDQALLAYLAATGMIHSRETLAGLLWTDLPEENARRNLRHSLSHLQKVIGTQWLNLERGVALTRDQPWSVDVHTLRAAVQKLTASPQVATERNNTPTVDAVEPVLQLYRGEFLQGFYLHEAAHFEEWVLAQREELRLLTMRGLEAAAQRYLVQGAYEPGLTVTHRLLQLEPWAESVHYLQMQLLARSGRRTEALAQYARCRQILVAELDAEPLPATTALYRQIQSGQSPALIVPQPPTWLVSQALPPASGKAATNNTGAPHNLLAPLAGFVGRQREVDLISQRLATAACRLLTIIGPGGMGKTSLAQAVGQRLLSTESPPFPDGIYFVALAGLQPNKPGAEGDGQAETLLTTTIAARIGCDLLPGLPAQNQLQNYLHRRRLLLILDNFEGLLAATDTVLTLLTQAPTLTMLITSRSRLNLRGETVLTLDKLSLPTDTVLAAVQARQTQLPSDNLADNLVEMSEAVAMFVQRAQCLDPYFTLNATNLAPVLRICQLVDGLPLGIELATSMLPMCSCVELATELAQSLTFLQAETWDLPTEQRTLQAVFLRSWQLLAPPEQTLLAKLAIFPATFHGEAAQGVAEATLPSLRWLINQSLVNSTADGRYALHPSVRAFALEQLMQAPEQAAASRIRYAHFYLDLLAQKESALKGAGLMAVTTQIYLELDNFRLAWRWAVTDRLHSALLAAMHALFHFYELQGLFSEAVEQAESSLQPFVPSAAAQDQPAEPSLNLLIGRLQTYFAIFAMRLGRTEQADAAYTASLARLQQANSPFATILCLAAWGSGLRGRDPQRGKTLLRKAVRQLGELDDDWLKVVVYFFMGEANHLEGTYAEAEAHYTQGYVIAKAANCAWGLANAQRLLGRLYIARGHYQAAETHLHQAIAYARQQNLKVLWIEALIHLGDACRLQGRLDEAQQWCNESRQEAEAIHHVYRIGQALWGQASLAEQRGEYAAAQALFSEIMRIGHPNLWVHLLPTPGWALIGLAELAEARRYFDQTATQAQTLHLTPIYLDAQLGLAYIQALAARAEQPERRAWGENNYNFLHAIYQNPATSAETRQRVVKIAGEFGLSV